MSLVGKVNSKQALQGVLAIRQGIDGKDGKDGEKGEQGEVSLAYADSHYSPAIISRASGEVVVTTDSAKAKPKNIRLYGKSEQKQYGGYQLFDKEKASDSSNWIDSTAIANVKAFPVYVGKGNTISFKYTQSLTTGLGFYLYISLTNEKRDYFVYHSNDSSLINNDIEFIATEDYIYLLAYESDIPRFMQYIGNDLMMICW